MELISLVQEVVCGPLLNLTDQPIISFSCTLTKEKLKIKKTKLMKTTGKKRAFYGFHVE